MATIAKIAAEVLLKTAEFTSGATVIVNTTNAMIARLNPLDTAARSVSAAFDATAGSYSRAASAATSHIGTILGLGGAVATVGKSLKAFAEQQTALASVGGTEKLGALAAGWKKLTDTLDTGFAAFGRGISDTGRVSTTMDMLTDSISNLTPILEKLGRAAGYVWDFFLNYPPLLAAITVTLKALTAALVVLTQYLITKAIVGWVTLHTIGTRLTTMQLLWASRAALCAAATAAWTAAVWALNAALAVAAVIGLPVWAVITVAIGAVLAVTYALVKAWNWLTTPSASLEKPTSELVKMGEAAKKATEEASNLLSTAFDDMRTAGWDEITKKVDKYRETLAKGDSFWSSGFFLDYRVAEYEAILRATDAQEKQIEGLKTIKKLGQELATAGLSGPAKRLKELQMAGLPDNLAGDAFRILEAIEQRTSAMEAQKTLAEEIAKLEQEAITTGMSDLEKRVYLARAAGIEEEHILKLRQAQARADDVERRKNVIDGLNEMMAKMEEKGQQLAQKVSPFENLKAQLLDIDRLQRVGAITASIADKARLAARKEFFQGSLVQGDIDNSPKALLSGTAEAALAENRAMISPMGVMTSLMRQELQAAQDAVKATNDVKKAIADGFKAVDNLAVVVF
jgi:hypothetical protein